MIYKNLILCVYLFVAFGLNAIAQKFTKADFDEYYDLLLWHARASGIEVHGNMTILQQAKDALWRHIENNFNHTPRSKYYEAIWIDTDKRASEFSTSQKTAWVSRYKDVLNIRTWHNDWEAHHIIPREYCGTNDWWNIMPLQQDWHRGSGGGIHYSNALQAIFPIAE